MYIVDKFILACSLRSQIVFSMTIIIIMICFLFSDNYIPNLLIFFEPINVRSARWYYDHHLIFKFFFLLRSNDTVVLRFFESVLLTIRLCITKSSIVCDITSFFAVREHVFYAIMNYENNLIDFSYSSQFFWYKQTLSERFATTARLIICI